MTDIGLTGGGAGTHMVYGAGKQSHTIKTDEMVEHIVGLVEARAEALKAAKAAEAQKAAAE
jgi:(E)-4-hydroxy-3-methylbut-2-enyl-diphosphate synthase